MIEDNSPKAISEFPLAPSDLKTAIRAHDIGMMRGLEICFPACVYSYDRATHTAEVMPLVKQGIYNKKWHYIRRKPFKVSVRNIQCGGFTIDFPLYIGDTGWVFSSDRDTVLLKQEGALTNSVLAQDRKLQIVEDEYQQQPNQPTLHSFINGFFIPDNWGKWETERYKDKQEVSIDSALYIGSSFDTDDNRDNSSSSGSDNSSSDSSTESDSDDNEDSDASDSDDEVEDDNIDDDSDEGDATEEDDNNDSDDSDDSDYQKGDQYEKHTSSSFVMQPHGGVTIASSTKADKNQDANISVEANNVKLETNNRGKNSVASLSLHAENGIVISQDALNSKQHFVCSITPGKFNLRLVDKNDIITFRFEKGKLELSTSSSLNMDVGGRTAFRSQGNVHLMSTGDINVQGNAVNINADAANVSATEARIVSSGDASVVANRVAATAMTDANVSAGENVNIGAVKTTNINAGEKLNLASGGDITVTAPDSINIVTAGNTTIMNKQEGAQIKVSALSRNSQVEIITEGDNSSIAVTSEGKESEITLSNRGEKSGIEIYSTGDESPVSLSTTGEKSTIEIMSNGSESPVNLYSNGQSSPVNIRAQGASSPIQIQTDEPSSPISILTNREESPISLKTTNGDVSIESPAKTVLIRGKEVKIQGAETLEVSGANTTIKTEGAAKVEAASVDISSSGEAKVSAGAATIAASAITLQGSTTMSGGATVSGSLNVSGMLAVNGVPLMMGNHTDPNSPVGPYWKY